ncbi:DNA/RNA nuclease SfsA [Halotalea alkalilenta]|uniref:DNA/RNA nuclease SfsA n=1 Tax=Halotalea alkalilenta TaxID=376489 RepID=UPI000487C2EA|nr:DNA/RNA nuclease SfsA [Halotalea alkalilenta]
MKFNELRTGRLVRRYKRFLADVVLDSGQQVVAHCANTGSMRGLDREGARVWLSHSDSPKRKLAWSWELIQLDDADRSSFASVNTARANHLVREALEREVIEELKGWVGMRAEVRVEDARLDFRLDHFASPDCYVEVKQVTLREPDGLGYFPDAVSVRGLKHLRTLSGIAAGGGRAVLLFCVAHTGIDRVLPAWHLDPAYAAGLLDAVRCGVEVLAYGCRIEAEGTTAEMALERRLEVILAPESHSSLGSRSLT